MKFPRSFNGSDIARAQMRAPNLASPDLPPSPSERPYGYVGRFDVKFAATLPASTREIFTRLAEESFISGSLGLALHHRSMDLSDEIAIVERNLAKSDDPSNSVRPDPAVVETQRAEIQALKAERIRIQHRQRDADGNAGSARRLIESAREYIGRIDKNIEIKLHTGPIPTLRKGETAVDAIETRRRRLGELRADINRQATAPFPKTYLKAKSRERLEMLAAKGAPDAYSTVEQDLPVIWATTTLELPDGTVTSVPDVMAVLAHLFGPQMIEAEARAIDAVADDENAMTPVDRAKALEQTRRDILSVEREETFFVREANETGASIQFRADTDPRTLLGLHDSLPAPRVA
jgi:hypothetical protein